MGVERNTLRLVLNSLHFFISPFGSFYSPFRMSACASFESNTDGDHERATDREAVASVGFHWFKFVSAELQSIVAAVQTESAIRKIWKRSLDAIHGALRVLIYFALPWQSLALRTGYTW